MVREGFRLGRVLGINIHVHWSWLLIFYLVTWNLGVVLGSVWPERGGLTTWGTAVVGALLFFGSVLVHEMAHSLVAKRQGIPVRSITLFLFGGVSSIEREPTSPRDEALITVVGPASSLILGFALLWIGGMATADVNMTPTAPEALMADLGAGTWLVLWLGLVNVVVGVFNLIPGFPLDGGRLLRAGLWAATGSLRRATKWAARTGQLIGWVLIAVGVARIFGVPVPLLGGGIIGGLWFVFIGWFLSSAAVQTYRQVVIDDVLEDVPVSRIMRRDPPTVRPDDGLDELVFQHMLGGDDHAFPVVEDDRLVALVTLEDIRKVPKEQWSDRQVRDIMTPIDDLVVVDADTDASEGLRRLTRRDVRQLPVLRGDELVGLFRRRDITLWLQLNSDAIRA